MAHILETAPSYGALTAALAAHASSVAANGGQHPTSVTAAKDVIRQRVACKVELKIPLAGVEIACRQAEG